jgi:endogenous inhibitor of DNA gyrase (YacG/DUF329 family)
VCLRKVGAKPRTGTTKPCETCGAAIYVPPYQENKRFCSVACHNAHQSRNRQTNTCPVCGKEWTLSASQKYHRADYCSRACEARSRIKRPLDREHNGKPAVIDGHGYVRIYEPGHPRATKAGWIFEHRWVVEQALGRYLDRDEHVHHINHVRIDNRPENLQLLSHREHALITGRENGEALKAAIEARQTAMRAQELLARYEAQYGPLE